MRGPSLTVGRGDENDLVLPDPDRVLSKRHCAIEDHNGNVVVVDISTNGTFLNYGKLPLGATPTPLNDGDILSVGPYEILVNIVTAGSDSRIAEPVEDGPVSHGLADSAPSVDDLLDAPGDGGDFLDDLLGGREGLVGPGSVDRREDDDDDLLPPLGDDDLLPPASDPYAGQGASSARHNPSSQDSFSAPRHSTGPAAIPDDWDDDFLAPSSAKDDAQDQPPPTRSGDEDDPFADLLEDGAHDTPAFLPDDIGPEAPDEVADTPPLQPTVQKEDPAPSVTQPLSAPTPEPAATTSTPTHTPGDSAAARAFLKSLGAEEMQLNDADLTPTLSRMGHVLRLMIEGLREILMTRTSIKSEFRIEQTMIQAGGNNPLKFSISPEQAIEALVKPKSKGYLDATEATTQALQDIKAHEVAMITGMEAALKGILTRLDPKVLEDKIAVSGGFSNLLKSRKARYWEIYENMYAEISDQAENDFHELFAKEFARAYKAQLDKLK
ncbi:type VI secretion system-associated FHA domain protein TagH [Pseudosulfitobacter koreensis]|uniref:Type VI secretion system-associated FHA domain protein TagH n=1 Tax=Pseudosulfitobacter koreensis TaxID=2968472 RepID=A0ABT1Z2K8_9RHOB|nr:type VI secretion system-associated FHA domain protein TagH [Pseudosulfitobacter koreense]